jgi:hypothetical protein
MSPPARPARPARSSARSASKPATTPAAAPAAKKAAAKKAADGAPKAKAKPAPPVPAKVEPKAETKAPKKPKPVLVRDGFTMPEADFALIAALKKRAAGAGREAKKSELLRAGLRALAALESATLVAALNTLEPVKVGRPRKGH